MRVLLCHNYYRLRGGEDQAFESEAELLRANGHAVETYSLANADLQEDRPLEAARRTFWNPESHAEVERRIASFRPDVLHAHNTFPQLSPSIFAAAKAQGVATVQTLHNFRLGCVNGLFFRDGQVCEACLGAGFAWPGVKHRCYRGSLSASLATASMNAYHWRRGSWASLVDRYICLTEFGRSKFVEIGLPPERLSVKPNVVPTDPGRGPGDGGYALWVGRLSVEKGVEVLVDAWRGAASGIPLSIYGDGPLRPMVEALARDNACVKLMGHQPRDAVFDAMRRAMALVLPSICYEGFPMALIESMAMGVPAVASRLGAMAAIVVDGRTGALFAAGDASGLAANLRWLADHPADQRRLAEGARAEYEDRYTAPDNLRRLIEIYNDAIAANAAGSATSSL